MARTRAMTGRWRPALRSLAGALTVGTVLALTAGASTASGSAPGAAATRPAVAGQSSDTAPRLGTWAKLPAAPITGKPGMLVSVWTGREMIIHGIQYSPTGVTSGVALAYRPATRTWTRLPAGPLPKAIQSGDVAVWTGSRMLLFGQTNASYNPVTNTWRALASPGMPMPGITGWTGRQFLSWGGTCCGGTSRDGKAYDPVTNTWHLLPAAPLAARSEAEGAWTGRELVVAGGEVVTSTTTVFRDGAAYNPATGKWRKLPVMPRALPPGRGLWDGKEVLFLSDTGARGLAYNPATNRWRLMPAMPLARSGYVAAWTGSQVLVWGGLYPNWQTPAHGEVYSLATNLWSALPGSPLHGRFLPTGVWTGRQMIVWGGFMPLTTGNTYYNDGAAYTP